MAKASRARAESRFMCPPWVPSAGRALAPDAQGCAKWRLNVAPAARSAQCDLGGPSRPEALGVDSAQGRDLLLGEGAGHPQGLGDARRKAHSGEDMVHRDSGV